MWSLERSHRNTDIDQVDPEHINRGAAEFSWDDLNKVPFRGNQQQSSGDRAKSLKSMIDDLLADDETIRSRREEEARQRVQDAFRSMDDTGAFGKNVRSNKLSIQEFNERVRQAQETNRDNQNQKLSDISSTF